MRTLSKAQSAAVARNRERAFLTPDVAFVSAAERKRILHERAVALAQEIESDDDFVEEMDVVVFAVDRREMAVECPFARESHLVDGVTPLACTPDHVMGIVNLRGVIVPVIDLRKILALASDAIPIERILVVDSDLGPVAFQIDSLAGVRTIARELITDAEQDALSAYYRGRTSEGLPVLDVANLVALTCIGRPDDEETTAE